MVPQELLLAAGYLAGNFLDSLRQQESIDNNFLLSGLVIHTPSVAFDSNGSFCFDIPQSFATIFIWASV